MSRWNTQSFFITISGGNRIYFASRWSRTVTVRRVRYVFPHPKVTFFRKAFALTLSVVLMFYPVMPAYIVAEDGMPAPSSVGDDGEDVSAGQESEETSEADIEEGEVPDERSEDVESEESSTEPIEEVPAQDPTEEESVPEKNTTAEPTPVAASLPTPTEESKPSEEPLCQEGGSGGEEDESAVLVESCNKAEVASEVEALSDTGDNEVIADTVGTDKEVMEENEETQGLDSEIETSADSDSETTSVEAESVIETIETGDAGATAVLVSDVNTTIVGTDINKEVVTVGSDTEGDIDLLASFENSSKGSGSEDGATVSGDGVIVESSNVAEVTNVVAATAETGGNSIEGGNDSSITTGGATALALAVNIVNTTLVGSNGLLAIVNIIGEYLGNIILPGEGLLSFGDGATGSLETVENDNEAIIENTVIASADTGGNAIENTDVASITTGNAVAVAKSEMVVNTNFVGNNWLVVIVNVFGEWFGGIVDGEDMDMDGVMGYFFGAGGDGDGCETGCGNIVSVSGKNVAYIVNSVIASANTGGNVISGGNNSSISTGDAMAVAATFNFVNNNIIGSNWFLGIVNVFGSWGGNLVFAYPDLEVSIDDDAEYVSPGGTLVYRVTVRNIGKAAAKDTHIKIDFPARQTFQGSTMGEYSVFGDTVSWSLLGGLGAGQEVAFEVRSTVANDAADGDALVTILSATTTTTEKHIENNDAVASTTVKVVDNSGGGEVTYFDTVAIEADADLDIHRFLSAPRETRSGSFVSHRLIVKNDGNVGLSDIIVEDDFFGPDGFRIGTYSWDIGGLAPGQGALIEYAVVIPEGVPEGTYRYLARAVGKDDDGHMVRSEKSKKSLAILSSVGRTLGLLPEMAAAEEFPVAEAAVDVAPSAGVVSGAVTEGMRRFPIWMLLLSGVAYYLMLNWSFFPRTLNEHRRYEDEI